MTTPRVLGLDFGLKRIGVAVGNIATRTAQALSTVQARDGVPNWPQLQKQIDDWRPKLLVVGLPVNMNGGEGTIAKQARKFGADAGKRFNLEVVFVDERLSTRAADELLQTTATTAQQLAKKRAKERDNVAAELITLTYLADCADV